MAQAFYFTLKTQTKENMMKKLILGMIAAMTLGAFQAQAQVSDSQWNPHRSLFRYVQDCAVKAKKAGEINMEQVKSADDALALVGVSNPDWTTALMDNGGKPTSVSCQEAHQRLSEAQGEGDEALNKRRNTMLIRMVLTVGERLNKAQAKQ